MTIADASIALPSRGRGAADALPLWRLYALRCAYLIMAVGLALTVWPSMLHHTHPWGLMQGVVKCVLTAVSLLAILGLFQPVRMIPLLLFEMVWKGLWLLVVALPASQAGAMDADMSETVFACLLGVIFPVVIPWGYVLRSFGLGAGERWR